MRTVRPTLRLRKIIIYTISPMKFDLTWDDVKRQTTLIDRGIDFADAESVFAGPVFEFEDIRRDYGE